MEVAAEFRKMLGELDRADLANSPNLVTTKNLFDKLINAGFAEMEATDILGAIEISVDNNFINDGLLEETTDTFVNLIVKMKKEYQKISPYLFSKVFKTKSLSIKYYY